MPFDLQVWKDRLHEKLVGLDLKAQAIQRKTLYGVIVAAALAPVVSAAQTGDPAALIVAGQTLAGSVGVGLLTNLLQKKQDGVDAEWGGAAPETLAAQALADPELRETLDNLLEKLDALALARNSLPEAEREWFAQALKQELEKLGNASTYSAALNGDGAIAQGDNAKAVGADGVLIEGDNSGDVNTGTRIDTGGGAYIGGAVSAGGDVVGRDKVTNVYLHGAGDAPEVQPISALAQKLRALLADTWFSLDDLQDLAFSLGIDWDTLPGDAKPGKARALARHCEQRAMLPRLQRAMRMMRPNLKAELE